MRFFVGANVRGETVAGELATPASGLLYDRAFGMRSLRVLDLVEELLRGSLPI